jgi:hypothetical protein
MNMNLCRIDYNIHIDRSDLIGAEGSGLDIENNQQHSLPYGSSALFHRLKYH